MHKRKLWGMAALCLAAFALRLGPAWANRFHPDEALYASWGLLIRTGRDVWLSQQTADKPPLVFYLMAASFNYVWRSEIAARLPSLIAGTVSVPLVFQISNTRPHHSAFNAAFPSWIAAALMAFSPYAIVFSATAFLDPVMVMFALAACAAARRRRAGWAGVLLGLAAAAKLTGLLFLPLVVGFYILDSKFPISNLKSQILFWGGLLETLAMVLVWDRLKGGAPFWVVQAINYGPLGLAPLSELLPRLKGWLEFLPYFFGWPVIFVLAVLALINFKFKISLACPPGKAISKLQTQLQTRHLLLAFALCYFAAHWLFTFQMWDRYLLGLAPVLALLAGELVDIEYRTRMNADKADSRRYQKKINENLLHPPAWSADRREPASPKKMSANLTLGIIAAVLTIALLPPALTAAHSGYPIGNNPPDYDGIEQVADYLRAQPEGTVVYDRWLGWEFKYYLWDAQLFIAHFPTPDVLRNDLQAYGGGKPRYVTLPAREPAEAVLAAINRAGLAATPVLTTTNRYGQTTFTVYQIAARGH